MAVPIGIEAVPIGIADVPFGTIDVAIGVAARPIGSPVAPIRCMAAQIDSADGSKGSMTISIGDLVSGNGLAAFAKGSRVAAKCL